MNMGKNNYFLRTTNTIRFHEEVGEKQQQGQLPSFWHEQLNGRWCHLIRWKRTSLRRVAWQEIQSFNNECIKFKMLVRHL